MFHFAQYAVALSRRAGSKSVPTFVRYASKSSRPSSLSPQTSAPSPQITLRGYQEECIQSVLSYLEKGEKRLGVSLATGSGKTVIFTQLISRIPPKHNASQTLILAHRRELVEQAARHCSLAYPDKTIDIEMAHHHASGMADITVASIQSIMSGDRLLKFDPTRYKLVLVDEAHHIVSSQYLEMLEHFGLRHRADWNSITAPALVGVSATFSRFDGRKLGAAIDHIVYHRDYVDMIEENWLSDVVFTTVESNANLTKVGSGANGDFQTGALSKAINTDETNEIVVRSWLAKARGRQSTLVFCVDLSHVANLTAAFKRHGIDARFVTGDTPKKIRAQRVEAFKNGEFPVLLNCGVFTEGTDIPNIDCVLLARPTKSRNLLVQMIGRGMRLYKGKDNCHIIDMVSSLSTGVVSTPTLFGLDPAEIVENADSTELMEKKERKEREMIREQEVAEVSRLATSRQLPGSITFTDYDSVHDLIEDTSVDHYIRGISQFAWVGLGDDKFVLTTNSGNYLLIEPTADEVKQFFVKYYRKLPAGAKSKSPYATPRVVAEGNTFEHAVHAADTFAAEIFEHVFISRHQRWRNSRASQAQVDFLNKFRGEDEQLSPDALTKGRAGDMITKIKHGVRGKFNKASTRKRIANRVREKAENERSRMQGQVRVGPLHEGVD
ncbi:P-loop containing nucleoside triphosphate hydrolase protein [Delitschia confertaspora ATCC 74209]|uniref:P-loop containing nucleoside triphosphate hydrolase protein n=1 Tax=Delitschia confertaspora ATCC 74209 TaxID=1513339 RepID=A0A9P4JX01_9PLEO|nr:P-loop containing nucleoside triphosphate hydrolase protein [Delitschia confertaspora ATCC 74209]